MKLAKDILQDIVAKINTKWSGVSQYGAVTLIVGYAEEVERKLVEYAKMEQHTYPLIAATLNEKYTYSSITNDIDVQFDRVIIATTTDANLDYDERMELNFKTILIPLLKEFLKALNNNSNVKSEYDRKLITYNVPYLNGKKNEYSNRMDGIVITPFKFTIQQRCSDLQ